jgi:hypothetical protein
MSLEAFKIYAARISIILPALFPITLWVLTAIIIFRLAKELWVLKVRHLNTEIAPFQKVANS